MPITIMTDEEIVRAGESLYERDLRSHVDTPENRGKHLVLDITSGEYEIDSDDMAAEDRLISRRPDAVAYGLRIGYPAAYRLGSHFEAPST